MGRKKRNACSRSKTSSDAIDDGDSNPERFPKPVISALEQGQRAGDRRKYGKLKKNSDSDERRGRVQGYWNSMSSDIKKDLLTVEIADLREYFSEAKDLRMLIDETLSIQEKYNSWHVWFCCDCDCLDNFSSADLFLQHVAEKHIQVLTPEQQSLLPTHAEKQWIDMILNCSWKPLDLNASALILEKQSGDSIEDVHGRKGTLVNTNWPLSDDRDRTNLLEQIHALFTTLIDRKCLAESVLNKVIQLAVEELQGLKYGSQLLNSKVDQTPSCICFLGAPKLRHILAVLQGVSIFCGLSLCSNDSNATDNLKTCIQDDHIVEKMRFREDASSLVLLEHYLCSVISQLPSNGAVDGGSNAATSGDLRYENGVVLDSSALLSWVFTGSSIAEEVDSLVYSPAQQGQVILKLLEKELECLQGLCLLKQLFLAYLEKVRNVKNLCLEEITRRRSGITNGIQSYEADLGKRHHELTERVLDAITNVLSEIESLEFSEDDDDSRKVEVAIQKQVEGVTVEICNIDARIMQILGKMDKLKSQLGVTAFYDLQTILIPLVRSFLLVCLEDLADRDAIEKSDASMEALLAEVALESNRGVGGGVDNSKDKKKVKQNRKNKDPKVNKKEKLCDQTAEDISLLNAHDEDEQHKSEMELESEARKLEEALAYQRQVEYEAEQAKIKERAELELKLTAESKKNKKTLENPRQMSYDAKQYKRVSATSMEKAGKKHEAEARKTLEYQTRREFVSKQKYPANQQKRGSTATRKEDLEIASDPRRVEQPLVDQQQIEDEATRKHPAEQQKILTKATLEKESYMQNDSSDNNNNLEGVSENTTNEYMLKIGSIDIRVTQVDDRCLERRDMPHKKLGDEVVTDVNVMDVHGTGLKNEVDEYICFLNVMIQSLWHIRRFRDELSPITSEHVHVHVGDPCMICALCEIFNYMSTSSTNNGRKAVALTSLRDTIRKSCSGRNFFQEDKMNDASKVLEIILTCLHQLFTPSPAVSLEESVDKNRQKNMGLFRKYTSFFRKINANDLRKAKLNYPEFSFDSLLNLVETSRILACDGKDKGCGMLNLIYDNVTTSPHVFTTVLMWKNTCESVEDITRTLAALSTVIDMGLIYPCLNTCNCHCLVSMVCYYGSHYCCLASSYDNGQWTKYDGFETVKVIGDWNDVVTMCKAEHIRPHVLFFEAVND